MTQEFVPAPFARYEGMVLPEWIDSNGHMNLAYYVVLFDMGVEAFFAAVGFGPDHHAPDDDATTRHGPFAVETHTIYERELLVGERVRVASRIVGLDAKRLHIAHEMFRLPDGQRAAAQEVMYLHVDLAGRRAVPFTPRLRARLNAAFAAHANLPVPDWIGRRVAMRTVPPT